MAEVAVRARPENFAALDAAFNKLNKEQQKAIVQNSAMGETVQRNTRRGAQGLKEMTMQAIGLGSGFALTQRVIDGTLNSLRALHAEQQRRGNLTSASADSFAKLGQLAQSPSELARMRSEARKSQVEAGIDESAAASLQFALESAGLADQRQLFARLVPILGADTDPGDVIRGVGAMRGGFGMAEIGSERAAANKLIAAASASPAEIPDVGKGIGDIAANAASVGISDEEALAALSQIAHVVGIETGATQIRALLRTVRQKGGKKFEGQDLQGIIKTISDMSEGEQKKFLSNERAFGGFQNLVKVMDRIIPLIAQLQQVDRDTGTTADLIDKRFSVFSGDTEAGARFRQRQAEQAEKISAIESTGVSEVERDALLKDIASEQNKKSPLDAFTAKRAAEAAAFVESATNKAPGSLINPAVSAAERALENPNASFFPILSRIDAYLNALTNIALNFSRGGSDSTADKLDKAADKLLVAAEKPSNPDALNPQ